MFEDQYRFRDQIVASLERDLMGPSAADEVIEDPPITRYVAGILFPQDAGIVDASEDVGEDDAGTSSSDVEGGDWDPAVSMSSVRYPSSLGMTFAVSTAMTTKIVVHVDAGRYEPVERIEGAEQAMRESANEAQPNLGRRARPRDQPNWRRVQLEMGPVILDVTSATEGHTEPLEEGLSLFSRIRPADKLGRVSITLILINTRISGASHGRDADSYFQPKLRVEAASGESAFVHRPGVDVPTTDEDVESHKLLYRGAVSMATGHGAAVGWDEDPDEPRRASAVWTCVIPRFELELSDSNPAIPTEELRMINFVQASREESLAALHRLSSQYEDWIAEIEQRIASLDLSIQTTASRHIARCRDAAKRINSGINLLGSDSDVWEAFRITNRAMLMQRARSDWLARVDHDTPPTLDGDHRWRPFQVAFILLCLPGIASPGSEDRMLADLLWFPTGGGKTEAYLGLIAFTTALRRLREPVNGHGVTVLMRYTLRLLTIQQFERAALLICCLEAIRRDDARLGDKPIEIGLWVGRGATPNTLAEAKVAVDKLRQGVRPEVSNPLQLQRCPWCATAIDAWGLWVAKSPPRLVTSCRNDDCAFNGGLPIRVVDEDIYASHPTLIIATADKFASMPWREQCRSLFNADLVSVAPPELIIQDELHLISGPLGTLAGLYETAVDLLCTAQGRRPKVIASTATIRRADSQTEADRERDDLQTHPRK